MCNLFEKHMIHYGGYFSARERIWTWTGHQNTLSLGCQPNLQRACYGILSVMATSRLTIEIRHIETALVLRCYHHLVFERVFER